MKTLAIVAVAITLSAQCVLAQEPDSGKDGSAGLASVTPGQPGPADTTRPPADFIAVDKEPYVIAKREPEYPEIAKRAGIEGKVWVKIWVDKAGLAHEVVLLKSDNEIFNAPAIEAARQFRFTPAMMQGKPVDVWVSVPFKFTLAEKKTNARGAGEAAHGGSLQQILEFARTVLGGRISAADSVNNFVADSAQAVVGGELKSLAGAIEEQRRGKMSIEQPGRLVVFCSWGMSEDGRIGYIVARTDGKEKNKRPHYHTILTRMEAGGEWKIIHWHTWH